MPDCPVMNTKAQGTGGGGGYLSGQTPSPTPAPLWTPQILCRQTCSILTTPKPSVLGCRHWMMCSLALRLSDPVLHLCRE